MVSYTCASRHELFTILKPIPLHPYPSILYHLRSMLSVGTSYAFIIGRRRRGMADGEDISLEGTGSSGSNNHGGDSKGVSGSSGNNASGSSAGSSGSGSGSAGSSSSGGEVQAGVHRGGAARAASGGGQGLWLDEGGDDGEWAEQYWLYHQQWQRRRQQQQQQQQQLKQQKQEPQQQQQLEQEQQQQRHLIRLTLNPQPGDITITVTAWLVAAARRMRTALCATLCGRLRMRGGALRGLDRALCSAQHHLSSGAVSSGASSSGGGSGSSNSSGNSSNSSSSADDRSGGSSGSNSSGGSAENSSGSSTSVTSPNNEAHTHAAAGNQLPSFSTVPLAGVPSSSNFGIKGHSIQGPVNPAPSIKGPFSKDRRDEGSLTNLQRALVPPSSQPQASTDAHSELGSTVDSTDGTGRQKLHTDARHHPAHATGSNRPKRPNHLNHPNNHPNNPNSPNHSSRQFRRRSLQGRSLQQSADNSVIVWNLTTRQQIATLRGHNDQVTSTAFSPTTPQLASASLGGLGQGVGQLVGHVSCWMLRQCLFEADYLVCFLQLAGQSLGWINGLP